MQQQEVEKGMVVQYNETSTRWFIGTVRRIAEKDVEIEYLDGSIETVPAAKVIPLIAHLQQRQRRLSLTRKDLSYVLYFKELDRLSSEREKEMKKFLHSKGLRFKPDDWSPETRIQIWPDRSFIAASAEPSVYDGLLPKWMEPIRLPAGSRDPLGLQSHAERIANEYLPGLTVFTSRIGYYGFLVWATRELNSRPAPQNLENLLRVERALALCEFIYHGSDNSCRVIGQRSKSEVLQSGVNDRFRVPEKILRNQDSGGAFRLYSTSLESNGFAESAPELSLDGLIPLRLTDRGMKLAREYEKRVPEGFLEFALGDQPMKRDTLRTWGKSICLSGLGNIKYRVPFLDGFLLGSSPGAEARFRTAKLLFDRGLLNEDSWEQEPELIDDMVAAEPDESIEELGLPNDQVLMSFYKEKPSAENARLQKAAVFEVLSLAYSAIFAHAMKSIETSTRCSIANLRDGILANRDFVKAWENPLSRAGSSRPTTTEMVNVLYNAEETSEQAAIGGAIIGRAMGDESFRKAVPELVGTPVVSLLECTPAENSIAQSFSALMEAMIVRHEQVSINKNRQRWCYLDNGEIVRDDLRPMGVGWHSMRFPQLYSLCRDLRLAKEDLNRGE